MFYSLRSRIVHLFTGSNFVRDIEGLSWPSAPLTAGTCGYCPRYDRYFVRAKGVHGNKDLLPSSDTSDRVRKVRDTSPKFPISRHLYAPS